MQLKHTTLRREKSLATWDVKQKKKNSVLGDRLLSHELSSSLAEAEKKVSLTRTCLETRNRIQGAVDGVDGEFRPQVQLLDEHVSRHGVSQRSRSRQSLNLFLCSPNTVLDLQA